MQKNDLVEQITLYLSNGGLFNPELANHVAVRDLLIECREALAQPEQEPVAFVKGCNRGQWEIFPAKAYQIFEREQPLYATPPPVTESHKQEPVAHTLNCVCGAVWDIKADGSEEMAHTPDTTPPPVAEPHKRKPLSDEEIILIVADCASSHQHTDIHFARAIEQAHGIKENK